MNPPPAADPSTQFAEDHYDLAYPDGIENHWWHLARNRIVLREVRRHTDDAPVLDVGCGRGIAIEYLHRHGVECEGVELGLARPLPGLDQRIRYGTDAVDLPANTRARFGTILLLDVIEHLPDPAGFLRRLLASFENLSSLVLTVPARPELWSSYDDFYGHYRRYTADRLRDLACDVGWVSTSQSYFFRPAYPPMRLLAKFGGRRNTKLRSPRGLSRVLHRGVAWLMLAEYRLLPGAIPGTSLIATLRRPG